MSRTDQIITRAVELIRLDGSGKITNVHDVCLQIEQEFQLTTTAAYRYVTVEAKAVARQKAGRNHPARDGER